METNEGIEIEILDYLYKNKKFGRHIDFKDKVLHYLNHCNKRSEIKSILSLLKKEDLIEIGDSNYRLLTSKTAGEPMPIETLFIKGRITIKGEAYLKEKTSAVLPSINISNPQSVIIDNSVNHSQSKIIKKNVSNPQIITKPPKKKNVVLSIIKWITIVSAAILSIIELFKIL